MEGTRINNIKNMRQPLDFSGCSVGYGMYPTDIDALIEYKNSKYIIFEVKFRDYEVPCGQKLALQRMVDDFTKAGKQAIAIVCSHQVKDADKPIILAKCNVREIYYGCERKWRKPNAHISVKDALIDLHLFPADKINGKERVNGRSYAGIPGEAATC